MPNMPAYCADVAIDDVDFITQFKNFMKSDIYRRIPEVCHLPAPPPEEFLACLDEPAITWSMDSNSASDIYRYITTSDESGKALPANAESIIRGLYDDAGKSIHVISTARKDDTKTDVNGLLKRWRNQKPFNAINTFFSPLTYLKVFQIPKVLINQYGEHYFSDYLEHNFNELGCVISGPDVFTAFHDDAPNFVMAQQLIGSKDWIFACTEEAFDVLHPEETRYGGADVRCCPIKQIMLLLEANVPVFRTTMKPGMFLFLRAGVKHAVFTHSQSVVPSSSFFFTPMMRDSINGLIWSVKYDVVHNASLQKRIRILADAISFLIEQYDVYINRNQIVPEFLPKILNFLQKVAVHPSMKLKRRQNTINPEQFAAYLLQIRDECPSLHSIKYYDRLLPIGQPELLELPTSGAFLRALVRSDSSLSLANLFSNDNGVNSDDIPKCVIAALHFYARKRNMEPLPMDQIVKFMHFDFNSVTLPLQENMTASNRASCISSCDADDDRHSQETIRSKLRSCKRRANE